MFLLLTLFNFLGNLVFLPSPICILCLSLARLQLPRKAWCQHHKAFLNIVQDFRKLPTGCWECQIPKVIMTPSLLLQKNETQWWVFGDFFGSQVGARRQEAATPAGPAAALTDWVFSHWILKEGSWCGSEFVLTQYCSINYLVMQKGGKRKHIDMWCF